MKVEEQVTFLKNKKSGIGVGTPARLSDLIDNGEAIVVNPDRANCMLTPQKGHCHLTT